MTCEIVTHFSNLPCSDERRRQISGRVAKLQAGGVALEICLVHVEARHRHHAPGTYHIAEVDLSLAGDSRHQAAHASHEVAACAIEMAFNSLTAELLGSGSGSGSGAADHDQEPAGAGTSPPLWSKEMSTAEGSGVLALDPGGGAALQSQGHG